MLDSVREELGQHDRAVQGVDATGAALERGAVDLLLVADMEPDARIDGLIAAAVTTGAAIRVLPDEGLLTDDVVALLRWPTGQR